MNERPPRILVVDDNKQNLSVLEKALTAANYDILTAPNGPSALDIVGSTSLDLVLLDVMIQIALHCDLGTPAGGRPFRFAASASGFL